MGMASDIVLTSLVITLSILLLIRMELKWKNKTVSNGIFSEVCLRRFTPWR
jgi:hypothetical protein